MNPDKPNRLHYPALDGLRGLAILLVVVYHNFGFINYFFFGWLGVDLFFVLSGFLITGILLGAVGKPHFLRNFYIRRALRIFPLYYASLIIFLFIIPHLSSRADFTYYIKNQIWLWTDFQNWLYIFNPDYSTNILHHLWSLAVEEQFYIVWPFMILLIKKPGRLIVLLSVLLILIMSLRLIIWLYEIENLAYFNLYTFSRIDGICIGCILALLINFYPGFLKKYFTIIILSLAGFNFLFYFLNQRFHYTLPYLAVAGYTTFAIILALLVYESITGKNRIIQLIFTSSFMKFLGKISYGLYIIHWPAYILLSPAILAYLQKFIPGLYANYSVSIICILISVLLSWLSFKYFEKPFLDLKSSFSN